MRAEKWDELLAKVKLFCEVRNIDILNLSAPYIFRRGRSRCLSDDFTIDRHYLVDLFNVVIDTQVQEIMDRFREDATELFTISNALTSQNVESFKVVAICRLVEKFYAEDFTSVEKLQLEMGLKPFEYNVIKAPDYKGPSTISDLCKWLVKTKKSITYRLVFRVIVLVLTLPVSTATTERSFPAMKIVKTILRSKMEDEFPSYALMIYIEREITKNVNIEDIIEDFETLKERRIPFS